MGGVNPVPVLFAIAAAAAATPVRADVNSHSSASPRPAISHRLIPYGRARRQEMAAYAKRHYGKNGISLRPRLIVEHFTQTNSFASAFSTFATDQPDVEFHELPGVCAHFVIDTNGRIWNLVPVTIMCRHTVGLNDRAIGIEHVGMSDASVMGNHRQLTASIKLTRWLRCRYGIPVSDVIGHNESLSSRWYHERVASFRGQTHNDMAPATMRRYRRIVARSRCS